MLPLLDRSFLLSSLLGVALAGCTAAVEGDVPAAGDATGAAAEALWSSSTLGPGTQAFTGAGVNGTQIVGVQQAVPGGTQVIAYVRNGGPWTATQPLPGVTLPASAAVDAAGDAMVVWSTASTVTAAYLPAGSTGWSSVALAATSAKPGAVVDVDGRGVFSAAWVETPAGTTDCVVRSSMFWSAATGWDPAISLSPAGECAIRPVLSSNAGGAAIAAWVGPSGAGIYTSNLPQIRAALRTPAGTWAPSQVIEASSRVANTYYGGLAGAALTTAGDATVVWFSSNRGKAATKAAAAASWTTQVIASYGFGRIEGSAFTMDGAGDAAAAFQYWAFNQQAASMKAVSRPAGGAWGGAVTFPALAGGAASIEAPVMAMSPAGTAVLTWQQYNNKVWDYNLMAATLPAAGAWSAVDTLGRVTFRSAVGLAQGSGQALSTWTDNLTKVDFARTALP